MSSPGRPPLLDAQLKSDLCLLLRAGCSRRHAAELLGIDESTIRKAALRDRRFARQLDHAAAQHALACVGKIHRSARQSWRAAAWFIQTGGPDDLETRTALPPR